MVVDGSQNDAYSNELAQSEDTAPRHPGNTSGLSYGMNQPSFVEPPIQSGSG